MCCQFIPGCLSKMHAQQKQNQCGFMIGLSAITENWQLDVDFLSISLWPSCGFSYGCGLLAVSFALNHIDHLISPLFLISCLISSPIRFSSYPSLFLPPPLNSSSITFISLSHPSPSVLLCHSAQRKVTPDHRLPLSPTAMLNNAAVLKTDPVFSRGTSHIN